MNLLRALIVDPDKDVRRHFGKLLDEFGFDVVEAENGAAALKFACPYAIDLVVADIDLLAPEGHGLLDVKSNGAFGAMAPPMIVSFDWDRGEVWLSDPALADVVLLPRSFTTRALAAAIDAAFGANSPE